VKTLQTLLAFLLICAFGIAQTTCVNCAGSGAGTGSCTNKAVTAVNGGAPTCSTITSAFVDTSVALTGTDINTSNQVTATHLAAALPVAQGGTGVTASQGNGTKNQLSTGTTTTNDCVKFDANGNTIDAGAPCGGTGGQVFPSFTIPTVSATFTVLTGAGLTITDTTYGSGIVVANNGTDLFGAWAPIPTAPYTIEAGMSCSTNATNGTNTGAQYGFGVRQSSATKQDVGEIITFSPTNGSITTGIQYRTCNFTNDADTTGSCGNSANTATGNMTFFRTTDDGAAGATSRKRWWSNNGRVWTAGDAGEDPTVIVANQFGFAFGDSPNATTWTCAILHVKTWCASGCTVTCAGAACVQPQVMP
jgi:hypothetical protein